jgi:hypothetical protein
MDNDQRTNWLILNVAIISILAIAALVGILLAVGNKEFKPPTVTGTQSRTLTAVNATAVAAGIVENATIRVNTGPNFKVFGKNNTQIGLVANTGLLEFLSGTVPAGTTSVQWANAFVNFIAKRATNAKVCGKIVAGRVPNGPPGFIVPLCYTLVSQGRPAVPAVSIIWTGLGGRVGTGVTMTTNANNTALQKHLRVSGPVMGTVRWKLLGL